jgi:tetratricopeptide (TPR) repeat protein
MNGFHRARNHGVLLALLLLAALCAAQTSGNRADAVAAALQDQEFGKALRLLGPALRESPEDAQLWAMQGVAYAGENNNQEAIVSFRRSLRISPDYLPALQGAAQIEYAEGSPAAIPLIERILRVRPNDQTGHAMLAVLEYQQGDCAAAVVHFEKAEPLLASKVTAQHAYGICLVRLKQLDRAAAIFQRAVALDPEDSRERHLLAAIQLMAHKPQDALATLEPLLGSSSPDAQTLELASSAHEDAGETTQAVSLIRQAILLDPHNVNLYLDFAHISYDHNGFQVGINVLSDGISLQPEAAPLYLARGVLYVQLAEYDKAEADFEKAHDLDPRQSLSAAAQGVVAMQKGDLPHALATVQAKLKRKPDDPVLLYLQADILSQQGADAGTPEFRLAMQSAREAVALQPTLEEARGVLAKLYMQTGQYQDAIVQCRKALASNPRDQAAMYHLIQALRKTGKTQEIPGLLKRFALLREQASKEENERYRYKIVEEDTASHSSARP